MSWRERFADVGVVLLQARRVELIALHEGVMPGNFPGGDSCQPAITPVQWPRARVLVVDDHCTYRLLMGAMLEKLGVAHRCCGDGQSALRALAAERYDLILTDCRMPVLDGYSLTCELRRRERSAGAAQVPVLALTACLGPDEIRRCVACGMNGWLLKPVSLEALRELLRYWLPVTTPTPTLAGPQLTAGCALESRLPDRASLIDAFGSWGAVAPLLASLVGEARVDLMVLTQAQVRLDASGAAQSLHRLVGSVAFLGATGLEARASRLIDQVNATGVVVNQAALQQLRVDIERYLQHLVNL